MNSLPKTVTPQRLGCDLKPGHSVPESSTLTTRLPSHTSFYNYQLSQTRRAAFRVQSSDKVPEGSSLVFGDTRISLEHNAKL